MPLDTRPSHFDAVGDLLVLRCPDADSRVEIAPNRGAIVTSFRVRERELLYMDDSTLADASKNIRGGIPVLFPSPGRLRDDAFARHGKTFALKQHGFARNRAWSVSATNREQAEVTLSLESDAETLAQFPWPFALTLRFGLRQTELTISYALHNPASEPLPFAFGLHPYFSVQDKAHAFLDTQATRVFDNVDKTEKPFAGFDLTARELDLHLLDHGSTSSALHLVDGSRIAIEASPEFQRWVVWTLAGKDFVCLEPWTAPFDALNTGEHLLEVAPGQTLCGHVRITHHAR